MTAGVAFEAGRIEVAWTVSARAARGQHGFATAVLRMECDWPASDSGAAAPARVAAAVVVAAHERAVPLPPAPTVRVTRTPCWTHVDIRANGTVLASASFERGRLAYCTGTVVELAGLAGGTYDAPTAILECYAAAGGAVQAAQAAR